MSAPSERSPPTLGYLDIRYNTEPIRLLLHQANVAFVDKRYPREPGSTRAQVRRQWLAEKPTLGLDFPNLPYLLDGDLRITQVGSRCTCYL